MRGLRTIINHLRRVGSNPSLAAKVFIISAFVATSFGVLSSPQVFASQNPDNDIVRGGIYNRDLASRCNGDVKTIMDHYWIDCNLAGAVDGRACRDGNVYVGDRVVARNSSSIGRLPIQGSRPISIGGHTYYQTHNSAAFLSECLDAFVKLDANGSFKYAILKACGNPVWTPEPVVTPPPQPPQEKFVWVCELATKQVRFVREAEANDTSKYSKNLADCKEKPLQVCELATKKIIAINESAFDSSKHSRNLADCKEEKKTIEVCELATKNMITIDEKDFDSSKHSTDANDCKEDCADNPKGPGCEQPQLPQTGITDNLTGTGLGIGSLLVAGSAYIGSRKDLISAFLRK